jgi:Xaa-Pro aminopeptidase
MQVAGRLPRLQADLAAMGCDALLVTSMTNISYLTGFTGSAARLLVTESSVTFVTDGRYAQQATEQLASVAVAAEVLEGRSQVVQRDLLAGAVPTSTRRLGLEAAHVSWADQQLFAELFVGIELVAVTGAVEALRAVKDDGEVARIEAACALADAALASVLPLLSQGPTERGFAVALDAAMVALGAEGPSFATIVASGPASALPHHRPDERVIGAGDLVVIDFGALVDGYHSDMTRTFVVGPATDEQRHHYAVVAGAQAAGLAAVRPGATTGEVDAACREHIADHGWAERYTHGTGHGVGLLIHEDPWVFADTDTVLVPGAIVTVEPGVYLPGSGGVRVEDTVLVTADGSRPLTSTSKELSCLPSPRTTSRTV